MACVQRFNRAKPIPVQVGPLLISSDYVALFGDRKRGHCKSSEELFRHARSPASRRSFAQWCRVDATPPHVFSVLGLPGRDKLVPLRERFRSRPRTFDACKWEVPETNYNKRSSFLPLSRLSCIRSRTGKGKTELGVRNKK